jgi:hypothetical protein
MTEKTSTPFFLFWEKIPVYRCSMGVGFQSKGGPRDNASQAWQPRFDAAVCHGEISISVFMKFCGVSLLGISCHAIQEIDQTGGEHGHQSYTVIPSTKC